jgi:chromosome segregation ATPase
MEDQLEGFMAELEEADNNYDKLMDGFAESQRTVERMRAELNLGAQLVQKLQEEKVQLLEEIDEVSPNEEQMQHIRDLSSSTIIWLMVVRRKSPN